MKENPLVYLFSKLWHYSAGNHRNIVKYWILFIVANIIYLTLEPLAMAKVMDVVQKQGVSRDNIWLLFGLLLTPLIVDAVFWACHGPARVIERCNAFRAEANYRKFLLKGVLTLPMEWHVNHHSGDTIDKVDKGTQGLYAFGSDSYEFIISFVQFAISYAMLVYFSPSSSYIVLGMILITCWIITRFDKVILKNYEDLNRYENQISESMHDKINHVTTIVILRIERIILDAVSKKIDEPYNLYKRNNVINETKWFVTNMGCTIMVVLVLGMYLWNNMGSPQGAVIVSFFILQRYLTKISELFFRFANMYGDILQRKSRVMNAQILATDFRSENFTNHVLPEHWRQIEIRNLNFSYHSENGTHRHLDNISMSIRRGERIALIGKSGSSKTTFLKLFRDLYHPSSLDLSADGAMIPDGFAGISRAIALIPQDPEIFATTIGENITLGAEYSEETIRRYTDMACITADIEMLPKKFDSSINEKGVNLSSGQRQRLALARGLLACEDKSVVLLDEPTSSVDVTNEMQIYKNIFKGFPDKAVISSIHRLHLLPYFDRIYLFEKGRIIASGMLDELLSTSFEFKEVWKHYHERDVQM